MADRENQEELLDIYNWEGEFVGRKEKKLAHEEMRKEFFSTGKIGTKHKHVRLLLMNSKGRVILQKRSKWKGDNPGLWDKSVGGHVPSNNKFDLTILKECSEELGIPATIVKAEEFESVVKTTNLNILAIIRKIDSIDNYQSKRKTTEGKEWTEPSMSVFYIGYYDGSIWFIDGESCGIQLFSLKEIGEELEKNPESFTEDIRYFIKKWGSLIKPIEKETKINND